MEDREKFADYIFTASNSIDEHTAEKARLSSNSSWCAPTNGSEFLQIDLGRAYIVNKVATFGDARTANFVTSYKLVLSQDGSHWRSGSVEGDEVRFNV